MDLKLKSKLENNMSLLSFDFNLRCMADDGNGHKQGDKHGHKQGDKHGHKLRPEEDVEEEAIFKAERPSHSLTARLQTSRRVMINQTAGNELQVAASPSPWSRKSLARPRRGSSSDLKSFLS
jgi:hypothetical protein